jgi:hypothetical protein
MKGWRTEPSPPGATVPQDAPGGPPEPGDDDGDTVEREFTMAALAGVKVCPQYGTAPWPPSYQDRLTVLRGQLDALVAVLGPLYAAHRAFEELGGGQHQGDSTTGAWSLPAGARLVIQAGFNLRVDIGEIARGVVPSPDPVMCLASALCDAEHWAAAMAAFTEAAAWAVEQAREWNVSVPGFD